MSTLNSNYQNIVINLRSDDDAVQGTIANDSQLSFQFNRNLDIPMNYNLQVSVLSAELPHSWYTWDETIRMTIDYLDTADAERTWTIDFPAQNWSPCLVRGHFVTERKKLPVAQQNFDMVFNMNTLKWTFSGSGVEGDGDWDIEFKLPDGELMELHDATSVWRCFGYPYPGFNATDAAMPNWFHTTPVSPNVCDFSRFHTISVTSKLLNTSSIDSNAENVGDQHVLTKIPVNAPFGSIVLYKGNLLDGFLFRTQRFNRVDLAIRDHDGTLIHLNGGRFNITLLCQYIKKSLDVINSTPNLPPSIITANQIPGNAAQVTQDEDKIDDRAEALKFLRHRGLGRLAA